MVARRKKLVRNRAGRLMAERSRLFLPDHLDQVRMIASRGITEEEMSELLDISENQMDKWKRQYPLFKKALEEGYTDADQAVLSALYQRAIGYTHDEEKVFQWDGAIITHQTQTHYPPDLPSIKLWLTNRQKEHWKDRQQHGISGGGGDNLPVGLRDETKLELMSSILALIKPKPDNVTIDGRTGRLE